MKRRKSGLTLNKESLRILSAPQLSAAVGAAVATQMTCGDSNCDSLCGCITVTVQPSDAGQCTSGMCTISCQTCVGC